MTKEYVLVERNPTLEEYQRLHRAVGWMEVETDAIEAGLRNSLFSVCIVSENEVIGCGRVIGDGGVYFYVQDVVVLPEFQGKGVGRRIMDAIMEYLRTHARNGAFVGLMAAKGVSKFYERYGFKERPSDAPGMFRVLTRMS
ncbi:MAG TPA: GNAT family N-acetyltransferase [Candidatus Bathyarchaeia archaeon]|nr:GNAT family N-acetyltransferase [Candidatus Bathyarchaeia archaeon]